MASAAHAAILDRVMQLNKATPSHQCAGCGHLIRERFLLQALESYWHEDCLKCGCCGCRLGEVGSTLYTRANLILCKRDYLRLFGTSGSCAACAKVIPAFEMVMRAKTNVYHLECFACQQCHQRFCVGDRFYLCDNQILCEYDYEERLVFANLAATKQQQQQQDDEPQFNRPANPPPASALQSAAPTSSSSSSAAAASSLLSSHGRPAPGCGSSSSSSSSATESNSMEQQQQQQQHAVPALQQLHQPVVAIAAAAAQQQQQHQTEDASSSGYGSPDSGGLIDEG